MPTCSLPQCGHHFKIDARTRIATLLETGYQLVDLELKRPIRSTFTESEAL